jgi:hypothetical protein
VGGNHSPEGAGNHSVDWPDGLMNLGRQLPRTSRCVTAFRVLDKNGPDLRTEGRRESLKASSAGPEAGKEQEPWTGMASTRHTDMRRCGCHDEASNRRPRTLLPV